MMTKLSDASSIHLFIQDQAVTMTAIALAESGGQSN